MIGRVNDASVTDQARLVLILRLPAGGALWRRLPAATLDGRRVSEGQCHK